MTGEAGVFSVRNFRDLSWGQKVRAKSVLARAGGTRFYETAFPGATVLAVLDNGTPIAAISYRKNHLIRIAGIPAKEKPSVRTFIRDNGHSPAEELTRHFFGTLDGQRVFRHRFQARLLAFKALGEERLFQPH